MLAGNVTDDTLTFGAMSMSKGREFLVGTTDGDKVSVPVNKQWGDVTVPGSTISRTFLVEEVPFELVEKN